jgi:hypothetical protein
VTTTVVPANGRVSADARSSAATGPITMTAGAPRSTNARRSSVVRSVRCAGVVPHSTTATGVSAARPPAINRAAIACRLAIPMRTTSVPPPAASAAQSTPPGAVSSPTWPVTTVTDVERPRWVTGIPPAAGTATADVTPGTTSQSTPARCSASASSPPRPKRNGSPPFSRTTVAARRPCATSSSLISS